ncbi:MAG: hypothetical protein OEZ01_00120 [Candidatus Heimdallarchaeota archaeon]|nr:hypothetical protein [Candidatus Heimdallarchaeota archaeon]
MKQLSQVAINLLNKINLTKAALIYQANDVGSFNVNGHKEKSRKYAEKLDKLYDSSHLDISKLIDKYSVQADFQEELERAIRSLQERFQDKIEDMPEIEEKYMKQAKENC